MADKEQAEFSKQVAENTKKTENAAKGITESTSATAQNLLDSITHQATLVSLTRSLKQNVDDHLNIIRKRTREEQKLIDIASTLGRLASDNFELSRKGNTLAKTRTKLEKTRASIHTEIAIAESEILDSIKKSDKNLKDIRKTAQERVDLEKQVIKQRSKLTSLEGDEKKLAKETLKYLEDQYDKKAEQLYIDEKDLSNATKRLLKNEEALAVFEQIYDVLEDTEERHANINKTTGISGEILEGINRIGLRVFGGLGINLGVISESFDDAKKAMDEFGAEVERSGEGVGSLANRTIAFGKGITAFAKNLPNLLTDPIVLGGILLKHFGELNKETVKFQRLTGQTAPLMDTMNMRLATTVQYLEVASSLSERLGMNVAGAFSSQNLAAAAELMNVMGMTAEQAGQLALVSEINRTTVDNTLDTIVSQVNAYNRTNRTALNHGQIVNDIAKASEETLASFAGQPQKLTQAAAAARRLGLELSQVETIADNLLDFESSIENELQAQLITGQNINLAKARELALSNNLEGVGEEIFNNTVGIEKFSRMNRIEQQSMAKALGMSRQELARIALQRGVEVGLTNQALENAAGMTAEDLKRVEAMQQLTIAIQKVGQALAGPVEAMSRILGNTAGLYTVLGLIATIYGIKIFAAVKAFQTNTKIANTGLVAQKALATGVANELTRAAIASQSIRPAFPGAAVGRGAGGKFTSMGAGAAGSVGAGAAKAGGKLAARGLLRFIPYVGWALLAFDVLKMLSSSKPKEIKDGIISPDGGLMVSGPKGSIQLDPQDSIIAGTDLNTNRTNNTSQNNDRLIRKIDELIMAVKEGGDVFMDSSKVGESLAIGTYKSS